MTVDEAQGGARRHSATVEVDLWPGWVDRLPRLTFRIEIKQEVQAPTGRGSSPSPSVSP